MDPVAQIRKKSLADSAILSRAVVDSFRKLDPRTMIKNPVMFVVEVGAVLTTIQLAWNALHHAGQFGFGLQITLWLWFTVLFANFAEAMAEGRGKAQADTLRKSRAETQAHRLRSDGSIEMVVSSKLRSGDIVVVTAGEFIPGDGEVIEGVASVDESAITGESAPVIRESGGDRSAVTGGTRVLSDEIKVRITSNPGETFLDRMIKLVEGASRQKTPNEIALNILLAGLTIIFLLAVVTLQPFAIYSGAPQNIFVLVSLLVCLIPTTIGGLLSAIGIAGMDRMIQRNVIAMSGRAVEASGDVDVLLLDKTGTITLGKPRRHAILSRARHRRSVSRRCRAAVVAGRRNSGGTIHRCAGEGALQPPRPRSLLAWRHLHPVFGTNQNVWRGHRRSRNPQRRSGGDQPPDQQPRQRRSGRTAGVCSRDFQWRRNAAAGC